MFCRRDFMRPGCAEAIERKGKIALSPVRYRTEIAMGFPPAIAKFSAGQRRESQSAA
jgi:hypothetical protein